MDKTVRFAPKPATPSSDRRTELLAKLEAALRADLGLNLRDGECGLDPYNSVSGRPRREPWGARPR